jgi:PPK2 family polyphosphate:nucleotide phosphotransferase
MNELTQSRREAVASIVKPYEIRSGKNFSLSNIDPGGTGAYDSSDKSDAKRALETGIKWLAEEQSVLYAQDQWGLLLIFQARDAAGKDSTIKHVLSGFSPQGCSVESFKQPSDEELDHDFMWRHHAHVPGRGHIGIFNRSYYEEVLVTRVNPEILERQKIPPAKITKNIWKERFQDINRFEKYLFRNGFITVKFFLHVSREEQKKRFMERLDRPDKNWKFSSSDLKARKNWDQYTQVYEEMIQNTAKKHSPWYVVPADNKWYTRMVVAAAIIKTIDNLDLHYPKVTDEQINTLNEAREQLTSEPE